MNLNNLAGEKSDVRIQHASIASGNLSLIENNKNPMKQLLKKKKIRPHSENKTINNTSTSNPTSSDKKLNQIEESEKKSNGKSDKSNYIFIIIYNSQFIINYLKYNF